jgi:hypothetical protein
VSLYSCVRGSLRLLRGLGCVYHCMQGSLRLMSCTVSLGDSATRGCVCTVRLGVVGGATVAAVGLDGGRGWPRA